MTIHGMSKSTPASVIMLSFRPTKIKLFRSRKSSLLVVDGSCTCGSLNRIRTGDKAQVHVRPSSFSITSEKTSAIDDIECLAAALLLDEESRPLLNKGCWVHADFTKRVVIRSLANIERNRKGDRLVECTELIAVQEQEDESHPQSEDYPTKDGYRIQKYDESNYGTLSNQIDLKCERHKIFARWLVDAYGKEWLSRGSGVLDVAGGNGMISRTLADIGVPSTLLDPKPRCSSRHGDFASADHRHATTILTAAIDTTDNASIIPFKVISLSLNGDGTDLTSRDDDVGDVISNCSLICGLHPDQATEAIIMLALRLNVPFAIVPCCVMPSLFPNRVQRRYNNDPVRSYSAFCRYLLDMAPSDDEEFLVDYLPFVGRNKVIYRNATKSQLPLV
ncbi:hypothetical protein ACHAW5_004503 [Stephanodiscus triporus]|uniref:Methyltransferase domain-containing protein n=1 Tax=Stephanodiscus triporus TaxID=2934178 RepID=A0ABD3N5D5_9STRA